METNLKILPRAKDCISFLYLEYAKIEREDYAIVALRETGKVLIPIATINTLILGPGTSITHGAINVISASGCNILWCGDHMTRFYSFDAAEIRNSKNLLKQIEYYSDPDQRLNVVRKIYKKRFDDLDLDKMTLKELRGLEGIKVKETYKFYAKIYKVKWKFRDSRMAGNEKQDMINQIITILNQMLYAICHGIILSIGFSPSIGFIHTGNMESFVFDVADFYKESIIIPMAFQIHDSVKPENVNLISRKKFREVIVEKKLITQIVNDVSSLFKSDNEDIDYSVNELWDVDKLIPGSINYGEE